MQRGMQRARGRGEGGQALPWMLVILMLGFGLLVVAARLAPVLDDSAQARTAADAAALAGAAVGETEARSVATANGGDLVAFERSGRVVTVVVQVGSVRARARAVATIRWVPN